MTIGKKHWHNNRRILLKGGKTMTKPFVVVLLAVAVLLAGLGSLMPAAASTVVTQVPGNTVVQDGVKDFVLLRANPLTPDRPCSLPPDVPLPLKSPPWTDIKTAKITQIGGGRVDLKMVLQEEVPEIPSFNFVAYNWQFEGGCLPSSGPSITDKAWISVQWRHGQWQAFWGEIKNCDPRTVERGDDVDFWIDGDTVRVRVQLDDLLLAVAPGVELPWHAAVRRMPFVHPEYTRTVPVDVAPDVIARNPSPPPLITHPEPPAIWVPSVD